MKVGESAVEACARARCQLALTSSVRCPRTATPSSTSIRAQHVSRYHTHGALHPCARLAWLSIIDERAAASPSAPQLIGEDARRGDGEGGVAVHQHAACKGCGEGGCLGGHEKGQRVGATAGCARP